MSKNIVVLDLETKSMFDDVGGRKNLEALGISLAGIYIYKTNEYRVFREDSLSKLEELLSERPLVVGFNIRRFDMPILKPYLHFDPFILPILDIMEEIVKVTSHRVSLESVAQATLGKGKVGTGLDAIRYYQNGEMEKLERYCLEDVKLTKEIYEYGAKNHELFFLSKFGRTKTRVPVNWEIKHPDEEKEKERQIRLF